MISTDLAIVRIDVIAADAVVASEVGTVVGIVLWQWIQVRRIPLMTATASPAGVAACRAVGATRTEVFSTDVPAATDAWRTAGTTRLPITQARGGAS